MRGNPDPREGLRAVLPAILLPAVFVTVSLLASSHCPAQPPGSVSPDQQRTLADLDTLWVHNDRDGFWHRVDSELDRLGSADASRYAYELLSRLGARRAALGQAKDAEPTLRRALEIAEALGDPKAQCTVLRWLGYAQNLQGRKAEARARWTRLLDLATGANDRGSEAWALIGLGALDREQGRLREARDEYTRSAAIFRELNSLRSEMSALTGLGDVLIELDEHDQALRCLRRVEAVGRERGWAMIEASAENDIGCLLTSIGDPGEAERCFARARELHLADGNLRQAIVAGSNQALCAISLHREDDAVKRLEKLEADCQRAGLLELVAMLQNTMAEARWRQRRYGAAARLYRATLAMSDAVEVDDRAEALLGLSRQLADMDSSRAAAAFLREWTPWVRDLEDRALRAQFFAEAGRRFVEAGEPEEASAILTEAEEVARSLGRTDLQWAALAPAVEAACALGMPDSGLARAERAVACWERERSLPRDPEWRAVRGSLIAALYSQLGSLLLSYPDSIPQARRAERAFDALQAFKARTLQERMLGPGGGGDSADARAAVTCRRLQQEVLSPDELLLDLYLGRDRSVLFAVTPTECRASILPGWKTLEDRALRFHSMVSAPGRAGNTAGTGTEEWRRTLEGTMAELRDLLFGSATDLLEAATSVVVVPDGQINLIPPNLLLAPSAESGGSDAFAGTRSVQVVPAASVLAELRARAPEPRSSAGRPSAILAVSGTMPQTGQTLAGARREVKDLARRFRHVETEFPSGDSLEAMLSRFEVLHFAAHSTADDQYPWRSAIHLGNQRADSGGGRGEHLLASEIAEIKLGARLAFLSSCQSVGGYVLTGEGVQGLAGAFLCAGVPAVLASLWEVDDRTTARLVRRFYASVQRGRTVAQALAEAQESIRDRPETAHPYYWAGFVLIGDGGVQLDLQSRGRAAAALPWAIALAGIIGLGIPILARLRRPRNL